jgi:hypothetical protein
MYTLGEVVNGWYQITDKVGTRGCVASKYVVYVGPPPPQDDPKIDALVEGLPVPSTPGHRATDADIDAWIGKYGDKGAEKMREVGWQ